MISTKIEIDMKLQVAPAQIVVKEISPKATGVEAEP